MPANAMDCHDSSSSQVSRSASSTPDPRPRPGSSTLTRPQLPNPTPHSTSNTQTRSIEEDIFHLVDPDIKHQLLRHQRQTDAEFNSNPKDCFRACGLVSVERNHNKKVIRCLNARAARRKAAYEHEHSERVKAGVFRRLAEERLAEEQEIWAKEKAAYELLIAELKAQLAQVQDEAVAQLTMVRDEAEKGATDLLAQFNAEMENLREETQRAEEHLRTEVDEFKCSVTTLDSQLAEQKRVEEELNCNIQTLQASLDQHASQLIQQQTIVNEQTLEIAELRASVAAEQTRVKDLQREVTSANRKVASTKLGAKKSIRKVESENGMLREQIHCLLTSYQQKEDEVEGLNAYIDALKSSVLQLLNTSPPLQSPRGTKRTTDSNAYVATPKRHKLDATKTEKRRADDDIETDSEADLECEPELLRHIAPVPPTRATALEASNCFREQIVEGVMDPDRADDLTYLPGLSGW